MSRLEDRIKSILVEALRLEEIDASDIEDDADLFGHDGLGLDSVDALEIVMEVERNFGVAIADDAESRSILRSVGSLAGYIRMQTA